ncbi:MAG TPA: methyl-accepting chemotaxis protein [Candidatus Rifleibacterium sp.]|nr:methyl-accepting chemotaxis protein [Candidatus Rifleibacterium sp.]
MSDELEQKARQAEKIADGDLRVEFKVSSPDDILGNAMQKMVGGLNDLIENIRDGITLLNSMSSQISEASQSLYEGASDSVASLEQVSASMNEIDARTKKYRTECGFSPRHCHQNQRIGGYRCQEYERADSGGQHHQRIGQTDHPHFENY